MNIYPLNDKVVLKKINIEPKSPGGIVLTNSYEKSNRGEVIAIGKGKYMENGNIKPIEVKVGDIVIFNDNYGIKVEKINNEEFLILSESDILAIIKE
ncbi:co-chaperone GroES [Candidatus Nardonella dryophthoridicola]|uniref:Co-chaperonin GroES n=1 Tax=endosymbiont of Rhynchophorus ferrugineus TaxID=1972133 RepID=A0A2Z5TPI0_9GAMM|nr:co-chaperone GroES [Candidatus Nardonella dryophthoridicola]QTJ62932.1 co-chaperone GroES [Candidatus Nardonella dryophthoridicola]BBA84984.1 10 kDa chaperonin [endosymbiont of Rhynchophorus ferrugineus]